MIQLKDPAYQFENCPVMETVEISIPAVPEPLVVSEERPILKQLENGTLTPIVGRDLEAIDESIVRAAVLEVSCPVCNFVHRLKPNPALDDYENLTGIYLKGKLVCDNAHTLEVEVPPE